MFEPSHYQQSIFNFIKNEKGSAIVDAVAGSGKTTTIVEALKYTSQFDKVALIAFNKHIKEDLEAKVSGRIIVRTVNALGFAALIKHLGRKPNLDSRKVATIIRELDIPFPIRKGYGNAVKTMVGLAKSMGIVPKDETTKYMTIPMEDTDKNWNDLIEKHQITFYDEEGKEVDGVFERETAITLARTVLLENIKDLTIIDFDDQIYLPVIMGANARQFNFLFVDEAQDLSPVQHELVKQSLKPRIGRLIAVGDKSQSIYGFRGADTKSLERIQRTFDCTRLPLSISYRCPKSVIREAQKIVPHIEAKAGAEEGSVEDLGPYKVDMFEKEDLVLCRCTAPLIKLVYNLIIERIPATIIGREIGANLIKRIKALNPKSIDELLVKIEKWHKKITHRKLTLDPEADLSFYDDIKDSIVVFATHSRCESINDLIDDITSLFSDSKKGVILSTIHKAKGLEADNVYILNKYLMPMRYAKQDWEKEQEKNLEYVAITRAKKKLMYIYTPKEDNEN